jgi:hypothetical protein
MILTTVFISTMLSFGPDSTLNNYVGQLSEITEKINTNIKEDKKNKVSSTIYKSTERRGIENKRIETIKPIEEVKVKEKETIKKEVTTKNSKTPWYLLWLIPITIVIILIKKLKLKPKKKNKVKVKAEPVVIKELKFNIKRNI